MATTRSEVASGSDQLNGGGGQDLAIYFHPSEGDANAVGPINVQLAAGTVTTFTDASRTTIDSVDTLRSIERIVGTNSGDIFNATGFGSGQHKCRQRWRRGGVGRFTERIRGSRVETTPSRAMATHG